MKKGNYNKKYKELKKFCMINKGILKMKRNNEMNTEIKFINNKKI
jgi:hypothetical protein